MMAWWTHRRCLFSFLLLAFAAIAVPAFAQDAPAADEGSTLESPTLESLAAGVDEAKLAGHNAWMLTSCALVLFMTAPGLAMFYGGLVRKKNVLSVMMQCLFLMGLMTVLWSLYGYSLAFGGDNPYIGNGDYLFMNDVQQFWNEETNSPETPMEGVIPRLTHMLFQGMFFIITPALICGAFAERMKFSAMVLFSVLWGTLVYCPLCHWVWGGGILAFDGKAYANPDIATASWAGGALDFAGGTVVHISSGISALVCAIMLGRRSGWGHDDMRPHNLTYTALGAAMLWVGWFGFNAGSELASDGLTSSAFAVTHFSAAAGAVAWSLYEWLTRGKPSVLGAASGAVAGLVCITPAAGFVQPMPALAMGAVAGVVCAIACGMKSKFGYDDALDAFGVHGVGGTLGAILTGVFATRACWDIADGAKLGLIEGGSVLKGQIVATLVTWVFSVVMTVVLLLIVKAITGLRVDEETERRGLDIKEHEEEGYLLL
ncbi:Ammonium transporter NrgA [Posidoniimonas polymericola]|uniref:Ammonium transporter n=1 Tax=Posidoniimonas polymericola TaxID=2528002 RepID=A0A5C5YSP0_9BACT|nr:ammonium transporter [Posidoniimonas polymericola]TWT77657.1 Ammonium transporter NrgA [Posidoniimonas polymericola]